MDLTISNIQSKNLQRTPINLNTMIAHKHEGFKSKLQAKGIYLKTELNENLMVEADEDLLNLILQNLMDNAIKFTDKGEVKVSAKQNDKETVVSIEDNGIGMNEEKLSGLFNWKMKNENTAKDYEKAPGLGLIISRNLIEKQGGLLAIASKAGSGSVFSFTIPNSRAS